MSIVFGTSVQYNELLVSRSPRLVDNLAVMSRTRCSPIVEQLGPVGFYVLPQNVRQLSLIIRDDSRTMCSSGKLLSFDAYCHDIAYQSPPQA